MWDVLYIADTLLKIAKAEGKLLTPMQLVKLSYLAQAWSLALRGKRLYGNEIQAWQYGPIIPDLYYATKKYGRNQIPFTDIGSPKNNYVDLDERQFLKSVFEKYGIFDGITLSYLTHQAGSPWDITYRESGWGSIIPAPLIRIYYQNLLAQFSRARGGNSYSAS